MSFIRFQTGLRCKWTARPLGVFAAAGRIQDTDRVQPWFKDPLNETLSWFNKNLAVPPSDKIHWRSVFWFDCAEEKTINKIWDLVIWLRLNDVLVHHQRTISPGKIVYRDSQQIAAIPSHLIRRQIRLR